MSTELKIDIDDPNYLNGDELTHLFRWLAQQGDKYTERGWLTRLFLGTGLRVSEGATLRIADCHSKYIWIRPEVSKTKLPRQVVPSPEFMPYYLNRIAYLRKEFPKREWVFHSSANWGEHVTRQAMTRRWTEVYEASGLAGNRRRQGVKHIDLQKLRTTYATWEAALHELSGSLIGFTRPTLGIYHIQGQLGHARDSKTTDKYYLQCSPIELRYATKPPAWIAAALAGLHP